MVGQGAQNKSGLLADGQDAAGLCANRNTSACVGVQHTGGISAGLVDAAVNGKASWINRKLGFAQFVAMLVHRDQAGGRDFVKQQTVGIDQEMVVGSRQAGADMGKNQVAPAMVCSKAVAGREITAQLPFGGAYFVL